MQIISLKQIDKAHITQFFVHHWGSPEMVISTGTYQCDTLDGFATLDETNQIIGLITYVLQDTYCEIISLDSLIENKGIGSGLIQKVEEHVNGIGLKRIGLITTNDNLHTLAFYQKRGYQLTKVFPNAVDQARKIKPEIPLVADNGIPIQDEIWLEKVIN